MTKRLIFPNEAQVLLILGWGRLSSRQSPPASECDLEFGVEETCPISELDEEDGYAQRSQGTSTGTESAPPGSRARFQEGLRQIASGAVAAMVVSSEADDEDEHEEDDGDERGDDEGEGEGEGGAPLGQFSGQGPSAESGTLPRANVQQAWVAHDQGTGAAGAGTAGSLRGGPGAGRTGGGVAAFGCPLAQLPLEDAEEFQPGAANAGRLPARVDLRKVGAPPLPPKISSSGGVEVPWERRPRGAG